MHIYVCVGVTAPISVSEHLINQYRSSLSAACDLDGLMVMEV